MHGLGDGVEGGPNDGRRIQVRERGRGFADPYGPIRVPDVPGPGVGVGVDGDRLDAQAAQRPDDAAGHLAAVGDEDPAEWPVLATRPGRPG
jgi:hypothetical protein